MRATAMYEPTRANLSAEYRRVAIGEDVQPGDYVQIHDTYFLIAGPMYVVPEIRDHGPFTKYWTRRDRSWANA